MKPDIEEAFEKVRVAVRFHEADYPSPADDAELALDNISEALARAEVMASHENDLAADLWHEGWSAGHLGKGAIVNPYVAVKSPPVSERVRELLLQLESKSNALKIALAQRDAERVSARDLSRTLTQLMAAARGGAEVGYQPLLTDLESVLLAARRYAVEPSEFRKNRLLFHACTLRCGAPFCEQCGMKPCACVEQKTVPGFEPDSPKEQP